MKSLNRVITRSFSSRKRTLLGHACLPGVAVGCSRLLPHHHQRLGVDGVRRLQRLLPEDRPSIPPSPPQPFRAAGDDPYPLQLQRLYYLPQEVALPPARLQQRQSKVRQQDLDGQAGEPPSGAEVQHRQRPRTIQQTLLQQRRRQRQRFQEVPLLNLLVARGGGAARPPATRGEQEIVALEPLELARGQAQAEFGRAAGGGGKHRGPSTV